MNPESVFYWAVANGDKVLMWVLTAAGVALSAFILAQMSAGKAKEIVARALSEVGAAVLEVEQTFVRAIKEGSADGTLTATEKAEAKARAIATIKSNIGTKGLAKLAKILGVDIDGWLANKVEAVVGAQKTPSTSPLFLPPNLNKRSI